MINQAAESIIEIITKWKRRVAAKQIAAVTPIVAVKNDAFEGKYHLGLKLLQYNQHRMVVELMIILLG